MLWKIIKSSNFTVVSKIGDQVDTAYDNFIIENVNDHCIRMAVMEGEYRWHYHSNMDELFVVPEGELKIEIKDSDHKTSAAGRTVNLTFEKNADDTVFVD